MLLKSNDSLTALIKSKGITTWASLKEYICNLPYGRNATRDDFSLVVKEGKGTCSSKHALLKQIADLNKIPNISLILCMYKMNQANTPGIGDAITKSNLSYIPEAHCFLIDHDQSIDLTSPSASLDRIQEGIIEELEIEPDEVNQFKVNYHKDFMMQWIVKERIPMSFDKVWSIREQCINNLSSSCNT